MKTRITALLLCFVVALGLMAGCSSEKPAAEPAAPASTAEPAPADAAEPAAPAGNYKVTLITMDQMDQHWVNVDKGCKEAVAELGNVDYNWLAPDVKDDAKQIECINNAVAGGAQAILLAANGPDAVTASLKEAEAAGTTAGNEMIKALEAAGITEGKIGIVNVNAATASTVAREEGFRAAFEGTKFEILETQYGDGDAAKSKDIAANYITQGCVGIFGANEGSTVGTGNAIQEAGGTVIGVGFDKSDTILGLIKNGFLLCTMAQNPDVMGREGVKVAVKALSGETIDQTNVDTGVSVLNKDTI